MNYTEYSSQDRKILTWNKENFDTFIRSFTEDELGEMEGYLRHHPYHPIDVVYSFNNPDDVPDLIYEYVCHWLYDLMMDSVTGSAEEARTLLEAAIAM